MLTDPPYASGGICLRDRQRRVSEKYQNSETKKSYPEFFGDAKDQRGWLAWAQLWLAQCWRVACPETGRNVIGMELAPAYYEISRQWLRQVQPYIRDVAMG